MGGWREGLGGESRERERKLRSGMWKKNKQINRNKTLIVPRKTVFLSEQHFCLSQNWSSFSPSLAFQKKE